MSSNCFREPNVQSPFEITADENLVERQWLEHLWNHENMFETVVV